MPVMQWDACFSLPIGETVVGVTSLDNWLYIIEDKDKLMSNTKIPAAWKHVYLFLELALRCIVTCAYNYMAYICNIINTQSRIALWH